MKLLSSTASRDSVEQRRIAACVRACEGIPTELLEERIVLRLIAACIHVADARVREVLEELALHRLRRDDRARDASPETRKPPATRPSVLRS
jgi:hypothetical protein